MKGGKGEGAWWQTIESRSGGVVVNQMITPDRVLDRVLDRILDFPLINIRILELCLWTLS